MLDRLKYAKYVVLAKIWNALLGDALRINPALFMKWKERRELKDGYWAREDV